MRIQTLRDAQGIGVAEFAARLAVRSGRRGPKGYRAQVAAKARVNHGRWLADCPFCSGAELVDMDDSRFYCLSCHNEPVGGDWVAIEIPPQRKAIETILLMRPAIESRNWWPHESVADLQRENKERGL